MNIGKPHYVIGFMIAAAAVFGAAVTGLTIGTAAVVRRNTALLQQKALVSLFRLGDPKALSAGQIQKLVVAQIDATETLRDPQSGWESPLYKAYADPEHTRLLGYGFRFHGLGFWAPIEGLLAVTPELGQSVGLVILRHSETPGLGGRISEPVFMDQFGHGLTLTPANGLDKILFLMSTPPEPTSPRHNRSIQAITGATQTCMAMERILNDSLRCFQRAMAARSGGTAPDAAASPPAAQPGRDR